MQLQPNLIHNIDMVHQLNRPSFIFNLTIELNGKFFTDKKKQGDRINRGEELLNVEFEEIMKSGYDTTVLMVIVNTANYKEVKTILGNKEQGEIVIEIEA